MVIRSSAILHKQQPQTHFFNCPKSVFIVTHEYPRLSSQCIFRQLTKLPVNSRRRFSRACVDSPSEAERFRMKLRDGDIVVAYVILLFIILLFCPYVSTPKTDGLSDNVFSAELVTICTLVNRHGGSEDQQAQTISDRLVDYSRQCMASKTRLSPFESRSP
jgi:protein phosphatase PTC7